MSALHWICALTLALICCLTAQPVRRDVIDPILILTDDFKREFHRAGCLDTEATYYTPTDVNDNSLAAALNCSIEELLVIYQECMTDKNTDLKEVYDNLSFTLKQELVALTNELQAGTHDDFKCESSLPKPFNTFMENIKTLSQRINSH